MKPQIDISTYSGKMELRFMFYLCLQEAFQHAVRTTKNNPSEVIASHALDLYKYLQMIRDIFERMGIDTVEKEGNFDKKVYDMTVADVLREAQKGN